MKKDLKMNIRIDEDKDALLRSLGGHTKGLDVLADFFLENYHLSESFERDKQKAKNFKKVTKGRA